MAVLQALKLDEEVLPYVFLLFVRMSGHFLASPVFGRRSVPVILKAGFSLLLTLLLLPAALPAAGAIAGTAAGSIAGSAAGSAAGLVQPGLLAYALQVLQELGVGLVLGFIAQLFVSLTLTAGQIIDVELGLGIGSVLDPQTYVQAPVSGTLLNLGLLLYFLTGNGHLQLIRVLGESVRQVPVGRALLVSDLAVLALTQFARCFSLAASLGLPLIAAALLVETVLGMLMRSVPQINAYMVGIPLKVLLGLMVLLAMQPLFGPFSERVAEQMVQASRQAVGLMGGVR